MNDTPKEIDYSKAISLEDILPFYNDMSIDYADDELYESAYQHIWDNITHEDKPLDWRQAIQTISLIKIDLIRGMLSHKIQHDQTLSNEEWK